MPHDVDENVFQRALRGAQVAEADAGLGKIGEQGGDARALSLPVVGVDQLLAAIGEREVVPGKRVGNGR